MYFPHFFQVSIACYVYFIQIVWKFMSDGIIACLSFFMRSFKLRRITPAGGVCTYPAFEAEPGWR